MLPEPIKRFMIDQRDAVLAGVALAIMLYASGVLALETRLVASGFSQPLFVGAPAGDARLFIVEKGGRILVRQPDGPVSTFLNIGSSGANLIDTSGERGLLGLAFDPNFARPGSPGFGAFYVNYVDRTSLNTVVARYQVSAGNPNLANASSRQTVITVPQPSGLDNHKAGWIGFRPGEPDNLYVATGDGGSGNDPANRAQNPSDNLGKMLRINVRGDDFAADANRNYSIPSTNPFVGRAGNGEIWAYGLRNPYRNSFDRRTGDLWIADVGQNTREEIDFEPASFAGGANYGWRLREGTIATPTGSPPVGGPRPADNVDPVVPLPAGMCTEALRSRSSKAPTSSATSSPRAFGLSATPEASSTWPARAS
jgi:glucose/arabinose dehydrogenase